MANSSYRLRAFNVAELGLQAGSATTGVWTYALGSAGAGANVVSLNKAAAPTVSVLNIPVPRSQKETAQEDGQPTVLKAYYQVSTAALTLPPTALLNKQAFNTTTGQITRTAIAQTLTFGGVDIIGTAAGAGAAGAHIAIVTITPPVVSLADNESLVLSLTMNEAATSVLDFLGLSVAYN